MDWYTKIIYFYLYNEYMFLLTKKNTNYSQSVKLKVFLKNKKN